MGNDNKINEKGDVLLFLQEELVPLRKKKEVVNYDLEQEYAKTRKNKNMSIWVTLAATLAFVVGITWVVIAKMSATNREIEVSLDAFEDLNLRNLFNALSKTQDLYEKAAKEKAELQAGLDTAISNAKKSRDTDIEYIKRLGLQKKQRTEREERVLQKYRDTVKAAHEEYDEKIAAADIELKQYEEQLKSFDSENVEKAQAWEREMDSQRQVHELEVTQMKEEYEAKFEELKQKMKENDDRSYKEKRTAVNDVTNFYEAKIAKLDPVVKDGNVKSIMSSTESMMDSQTFSPELIANDVTNSDEEFTQMLYDIQQKYEKYIALNSYASSIPYSNGVSGVLKSERQLAYDMAFNTAKTSAEKFSTLKSENKYLAVQVENLQAENNNIKQALGNNNQLLNAYAKAVKVDGFVLSTGDAKLIAFIESSARASVKNDGTTKVSILNEANKKIASGALWFKENVYFISLDADAAVPAGSYIKITKK